MFARSRSLLSILAFLVSSMTASAQPNDVITVGKNRRQLFLDDHVIAAMKGLKRVAHQPQKATKNPILVGSEPWELAADMPSVLYDAGMDRFRMWYRCIDAKGVCRIAYAESKDGVQFSKPKLGLIDFQGSKENNLVWGKMGD